MGKKHDLLWFKQNQVNIYSNLRDYGMNYMYILESVLWKGSCEK